MRSRANLSWVAFLLLATALASRLPSGQVHAEASPTPGPPPVDCQLVHDDPNVPAWHRLSAVLDPQFVPARDAGSWELFERGKFEEAVAFVEEGIKHNPDAEILWFDKAFYLYRLKRYAEGQKAAIKGFNLSTESIDQVNCLRLVALNSAGAKDLKTEITAYALWLKVYPNDPIPRTRLDALLRDIKQKNR